MNMYLSSLLLYFIVTTTTASPLFRSSETDNNATSYIYDGYPQRQELETYSQYLLVHLKATGALSTVNLALWNRKFDNEQEASQAAEEYLVHKSSEVARGCQADYRYNYNKYRFPSTIITVECNRTRNYCDATEEAWPTSGSCLGDKYYLTTLLFQPDIVPLSSSVHEQHTGAQIVEEASGEFEPAFEDLAGKWEFHTALVNRGCLCLAK